MAMCMRAAADASTHARLTWQRVEQVLVVCRRRAAARHDASLCLESTQRLPRWEHVDRVVVREGQAPEQRARGCVFRNGAAHQRPHASIGGAQLADVLQQLPRHALAARRLCHTQAEQEQTAAMAAAAHCGTELVLRVSLARRWALACSCNAGAVAAPRPAGSSCCGSCATSTVTLSSSAYCLMRRGM